MYPSVHNVEKNFGISIYIIKLQGKRDLVVPRNDVTQRKTVVVQPVAASGFIRLLRSVRYACKGEV